jgi:hypothetical protein
MLAQQILDYGAWAVLVSSSGWGVRSSGRLSLFVYSFNCVRNLGALDNDRNGVARPVNHLRSALLTNKQTNKQTNYVFEGFLTFTGVAAAAAVLCDSLVHSGTVCIFRSPHSRGAVESAL